MTASIIDRRLRRLEDHVAAREGEHQVFFFIDDPEAVERCEREHPNARIMHVVIVEWPKRGVDEESLQ